MGFMQVSAEEVRAAQTLTTATFAAFMLVGVVPGLRPYAGRIRVAITACYLGLAVGFIIYLLIR